VAFVVQDVENQVERNKVLFATGDKFGELLPPGGDLKCELAGANCGPLGLRFRACELLFIATNARSNDRIPRQA